MVRMETKPHIKNMTGFKSVLANYHVSDAGKKLLQGINLVLLVAPTSTGKNTIIDRLAQEGPYESIISDTTRPPRIENGKLEQHGVRYFFRSEEEILADLEKGMFLEAALIHNQQVSGISLRELKKAADYNKIAINEIEVVGADNVHAAKSSAHFIFLLPPSLDEWLRRLKHRGAMSEQEIRNRTEGMRFELDFALKKDYYRYVVNDDIDQATRVIRDIVERDKKDEDLQRRGLYVAKQLLHAVEQRLATQ